VLKQTVDYNISQGSHVFTCFADFIEAFDKVSFYRPSARNTQTAWHCFSRSMRLCCQPIYLLDTYMTCLGTSWILMLNVTLVGCAGVFRWFTFMCTIMACTSKPNKCISTKCTLSIRSLRSTDCSTWTNYGDRSFAIQGPRVWNSLPAALWAPDITLTMFRNKLKTFLFNVKLFIQCIPVCSFLVTLCYINVLNNNNNICL